MGNEKYWDSLIREFEEMSDEDFLKTVKEVEEQKGRGGRMMEIQARIEKMLKKSEVILNAGKPKHNDIKVPPFTDGQKEVIEAIEKHKEKCKAIEVKINKYGHKNICDVDGIDDDITDIKDFKGVK